MIFQREINNAINWLFSAQSKENFGWSWVKNISPNEQNTAEVVFTTSLFADQLTLAQKQLVNEAVKKWLLFPQKHAVLTVDWTWVGMALCAYKDHLGEYESDLAPSYIDNSISTCVKNVLNAQNEDGGWGDYKKDLSTAFRTSLVIVFLDKTQDYSADPEVEKALERAVSWLVKLQNEDGGWGNICVKDLDRKVTALYAGIEQEIVEKQFLSSISATGYALWALSSYNPYRYNKAIEDGCAYLQSLDFSNGYEVFLEVGIRRGTTFTFRHFGAAWMGVGALSSGKIKVIDPFIVKLIKHFLMLYDDVDGGFRCETSSEVYTWSDCNSLMFLHLVIEKIGELKAVDYVDILFKHLFDSTK